jgi:hypothetical protein
MAKLAVLTGGGDCPGLNAVIRAVVKSAAPAPRARPGGGGDFQVTGPVRTLSV